MNMSAKATTQQRRPIWRSAALFFAGLGLGFQGFAFGVGMPIGLAVGGFTGYFDIFQLHVEGVPGGLDVAGIFFPATVVIAILMPLGIATIGAVAVAGLRKRVLPMAAAAAAWSAVALATVILSGGASGFLAAEITLLLLSLVAAWPELGSLRAARRPV